MVVGEECKLVLYFFVRLYLALSLITLEVRPWARVDEVTSHLPKVSPTLSFFFFMSLASYTLKWQSGFDVSTMHSVHLKSSMLSEQSWKTTFFAFGGWDCDVWSLCLS